jgi:general secretion pathway protein G
MGTRGPGADHSFTKRPPGRLKENGQTASHQTNGLLSRKIMTHHASANQRGITLIEVILVAGIIGVLTSIALPSYRQYVERAEVSTALSDIEMIQLKIVRYIASGNANPPANLGTIGLGDKKAPWGNKYEYLSHSGVKGKGSFRKYKSLAPINSDYDLYSKGKDGETQKSVVVKASHDDILVQEMETLSA